MLPDSGKYKLHINSGGSEKFWCAFDYTVRRLDGEGDFIVEIGADPDDSTVRWFPSLRKGMETTFVELIPSKGFDVGFCVTIGKIYSHPVDTTEKGCEYYGASFVRSFLS